MRSDWLQLHARRLQYSRQTDAVQRVLLFCNMSATRQASVCHGRKSPRKFGGVVMKTSKPGADHCGDSGQTMAVIIENAEKRFGQRTAVAGISLSIPAGSLCGFIGPNGSGKTTTLRMILRIVRPDRGKVVVLGADSGKCADHRVGYLPEERGLYRRMKVRELLRYYAALKDVRHPDPEITRWLRRLQADGWDQRRIDGLSKGMCQKIQFIAAVIARPQLLILDEPFSGLDPVNLELLKGAIQDLQQQGTTIILSTHEMETAQRMCDRVVMIYRGRKVLDGTVQQILAQSGSGELRVRTVGGRPLPVLPPSVAAVRQQGPYLQLLPSGSLTAAEVLRQLTAVADLEHFEIVRPSLHEIFLRLVSDDAADQPAPVIADSGGRQDLHRGTLTAAAWQSVCSFFRPLGNIGN